ncbi:hypothetical protein LINGRAHAP2_LOCUS19576 [Linum grandiflorum]
MRFITPSHSAAAEARSEGKQSTTMQEQKYTHVLCIIVAAYSIGSTVHSTTSAYRLPPVVGEATQGDAAAVGADV